MIKYDANYLVFRGGPIEAGDARQDNFSVLLHL
jgi:hypothetical protein